MNKDNAQKESKVSYNKDIVKSIVTLATKEINGISGVNNQNKKILGLFTANKDKGVKISSYKDGIVIDVYVKVYSNSQVNEVAWRVQENIRTAVQSMIDVKVKSVNVNVVDVDFSNLEAGF